MTMGDRLVACAYLTRMDNAHDSERQRLRLSSSEALAERALPWWDENNSFSDWYNAKVERDGLLLGEYRQF